MLVAEQCFCEINNAPVRHIRGRVELYSGSTLLNTFKHTDALKSFTIDRIGDGSKFFGYGVVHKLNVRVIDAERKLNITTENTLDVAFGVGCDFIYCYPLFYVSEVHRDENTNELSITAYDRLYRAAELTVNDLTLPSQYTLEGFAATVAAILGMSINIPASGFEIHYPNGANFEGTENLRQALNAVAEATQTIYYLNNEQVLTFKRLDIEGAAVATITKDNYYTLDSKTNRRLAAICHATELGDNVSVSYDLSGTTQYIRDNPFYELREDITGLVEAALAAAGGLTINQFDCIWRGNYLLEIGDKIGLITKDDQTAISYLLDDTITYDGSLSQNTRWEYTADETETEANPSSLGDVLKQTFARVDKANKQIELVASEVANNANSITSLQINTDSINTTVQKLSSETTGALESVNNDIAAISNKLETTIDAESMNIAIQTEIAKGTGKVITSTGFTFDNEGLSISKSGTEMETVITEDGMTVYRDNEEMLVANNVGVEAVNLSASTYLIVGTNSRFENYGYDRTGCFWIGG